MNISNNLKTNNATFFLKHYLRIFACFPFIFLYFLHYKKNLKNRKNGN